jgi:phospholipase/carboxylesterase
MKGEEESEKGPAPDTEFGEAMGRLGPALLSSLGALDQAFRHLHPPDFPRLQARLAPIQAAHLEAHTGLEEVFAPVELEQFRSDLLSASAKGLRALGGIVSPGEAGAMGALRAMRDHARAQAELFALRKALPPVSAFFAESFRQTDLSGLEVPPGVDARVGLFRSGGAGERGGFDLYVPESYDGASARPLVVALHGGSGSGEDFLWSWLREARSRGFLLLAPSSWGTTWSLNAPEIDGRNLRQMTEWVCAEWNVDRSRVLLTGLSDGATMSLLVGLGEDVAYTHLAPISGVLHPMNFASGNVDRARGKSIYLVHGALDWMFPVQLAREAARVLDEAGSELVFRELSDLSHTYPREENGNILEWFAPALAEAAVLESVGTPS